MANHLEKLTRRTAEKMKLIPPRKRQISEPIPKPEVIKETPPVIQIINPHEEVGEEIKQAEVPDPTG